MNIRIFRQLALNLGLVATLIATLLTPTTLPSATAAGLPGQPPQPTVSLGSQVQVSWTAPFDNGSAITSYRATANPGGASCTATAPATNCSVSGLTWGTSYTFSVTATNGVGTSAASVPSTAIIPSLTSQIGPELPLGFSNVTRALTLSDGSATIYVVDETTTSGSKLILQTMASPNAITVSQLAQYEKAVFLAFDLSEKVLFVSTATQTPVDPNNPLGSKIHTARILAIDLETFAIVRQSLSTKTTYFVKQMVPLKDGIHLLGISSQFRSLIRISDLAWVENVELWDTNTGLVLDPTGNSAYWTNWVNSTSPYGYVFRMDIASKKVVTSASLGGLVGRGLIPEMFWSAHGQIIAVTRENNSFGIRPNYVVRYRSDFAARQQADIGSAYSFSGEVLGVKSFDRGLYAAIVVFRSNRTDLLKIDTGTLQVTQTIPLGAGRIPVAMTTLGDSRLRIVYSTAGTYRDLFITDVAGPPVNPVGDFRDSAVHVRWQAPSYAGASPVESYKVVTYPGGETCESQTLSCTITQLTNGTPYSFRVFAVSAEGESPASALSAPVVPATIPGPPTSVMAEVDRDRAAIIVWQPPADNGGDTVSTYLVYRGNDLLCTTTFNNCRVTGLTPGEKTSFTVTGQNKAGPGASSLASNEIIPITVPGAPNVVTTAHWDKGVRVFWSAPSFEGHSSITNYRVVAEPGGSSCQVDNNSARDCFVSGLTNGVSYIFRVQATNAAGTGSFSANSAAVIPRTIPQAPTSPIATAGDREATIRWTAPTNNGGAAITSFTVRSSPAGFSCTTALTTCNITGLANGTSYTFTVVATNPEGSSAASTATAAIIPNVVPNAPQNASATHGNASANIEWALPVPNGGTPLLNFTVQAFLLPTGFGSQTLAASINVGPTATSHTFTGLINGRSYILRVFANNALGFSTTSTTTAVVPRTVPSAPSALQLAAFDKSVQVSWTAPNNGGAIITGYLVEALFPDSFERTGQSCVSTTTNCVVPGLENGRNYRFRVQATNSEGSGNWSTTSVVVKPDVAPSPPAEVYASYGNAQAIITWSLPTPNGGTPILSYEAAVKTPLNQIRFCRATAPARTCTITGLTNGASYTFIVKSINAHGMGFESSPTAIVIPRTTPTSPQAPSVTRGDTKVTLSWNQPTNGGALISGYVVQSESGNETCSTTEQTTCEITGLTNGVSYRFQVRSINSEGSSAWSSFSSSVMPNVLPNPPTGAVAKFGFTSARVSWSPPVSNGGTQITQYTVTSAPGGRTCTSVGVTNCVVTGLNNGWTYTFTVRAANALGAGLASTPSNAVTPQSNPGAVSAVEATHLNSSVRVSWSPVENIDHETIVYQVVSSPSGMTCTVTGVSECTISGLTNGVSYQFSVVARYSNGVQGQAVLSAFTVPSTRPQAPISPQALPGFFASQVSWIPPVSDGGSQITQYEVVASPGGRTCTTTGTFCTVTDLALGSRYTFQVRARNLNGWGPYSDLTNETLISQKPDAPNSVYAIPASFGARVFWGTPLNTGGLEVERYLVTSTPGGFVCVTGGATNCAMNGLQNGIDYTFTVKAYTEFDESATSIASVPIKPVHRNNQPSALSSAFISPTDIRAVWSPVVIDGVPARSYLVELLSRVAPYETIESESVPAGQLTYVFQGIDPANVYRIQVTAMDIDLNELGVLSLDAQDSRLPAQFAPASITGALRANGSVVSSFGSWIGSPLPTISRQWFACNQPTENPTSVPAGCTAISRATSATFVPNSTHIGKHLLVAVTATNTAGSVTTFGSTTDQIGGAPAATRLPSITFPRGLATESNLTANPGAWQGSPVPLVELQWQRCIVPTKQASAMLQSCSNITGEVATSYVTSSLDVGRYIRFVVTATNIHGTQTFYSASSPIVIARVANLVVPMLSGEAVSGQPLTASPGLWAGNPTFRYQWYVCSQQTENPTSVPAGCTAISRATSATFVPKSRHIGQYLLVVVTASNGGSSATSLQLSTLVR